MTMFWSESKENDFDFLEERYNIVGIRRHLSGDFLFFSESLDAKEPLLEVDT